jgi:hypothetical protein
MTLDIKGSFKRMTDVSAYMNKKVAVNVESMTDIRRVASCFQCITAEISRIA